MPHIEESCLNEDLTRKILHIHSLLKEARDEFESLPEVIKDAGDLLDAYPNSMQWYIFNTEAAMSFFADKFGIEVDR